MENIKRIDINGEEVYLKKGWLGWRTIEPMKDKNGKTNWFNLIAGGKRGFAFLIFVLILTGMFYFGINELIGNYKMVAEDPCEFCTDCQQMVSRHLSNAPRLNIPEINLSNVKVINS